MAEIEESLERPSKRVRVTEPELAEISSPINALKNAQLEQESKVGITVFAANDSGFTCTVKQRYTDFLVNEISTSGHVLHYESSPDVAPNAKSNGDSGKDATGTVDNQPKEQREEPPQTTDIASDQRTAPPNGDATSNDNTKIETAKQQTNGPEKAALSATDLEFLISTFGEKTTNAMQRLYEKILSHPDKKARDFDKIKSEIIDDKEQRTGAHIAVRRIFNGRIETVTDDDSSITIKAASQRGPDRSSRNAPQKGSGPRAKGKAAWDELGGEHLHFTLYKENKDTMEVLGFVSSKLHVQPKVFQMAGTKDRRAVSVQRISAFRVSENSLKGLNPILRGARLCSFKYEVKGLELGDLVGNEFTITLRDCQVTETAKSNDSSARLEATRKAITNAIDHFRTYGFINYFGLQRFGAFSISTAEIGQRMLRDDLSGAVDGLLSYPEAALSDAQDAESKISNDDRARAEALKMWQTTHKIGPALEKLPRRFVAEATIIKHLGWTDRNSGEQRQSRDWQGALAKIPRNLRLMYVHAYQSLVWNTVAGHRWQTYGAKTVEGDLVLISEHQDAANGAGAVEEEDVDDDGEVIVRPAAEDSATAVEEKFERARPLTKAEAESGRFNVFDIVLPLPGFDVVYPPNTIGEFYKEWMASDAGGGLDPYNMRRKWKDISLSGSYRKLMARPLNVDYEIKTYSGDEEQLVQTDMDKVNGPQVPAQTEGHGAEGNMEIDGQKVALIVKMQLASSQYATMALRELTNGGALSYKPDFSGGR